MSARVLVVGGGVAGLVSALLVKKHNKDAKVTLVEAGSSLGGLLKSFYYPGYGYFDYGTHYLMESGVRELDEIFEQALPLEERHTMTGYATDVSGVYYGGRLQRNTPFPDLRGHRNWQCYVSEVLSGLPASASVMPESCGNAQEYFEKRFGRSVAAEVISPIIKKLFDSDLLSMSVLGARFVPLSRVGLFDLPLMKDLINTEHCSKLLAFPEQRELPLDRQPTLNAFYPNKVGIGRVIDGLRRLLEESGIDVRTDTAISDFKVCCGRIEKAKLESRETGEAELLECDVVINAGGILSSAKLLPLEGKDDRMDKPLTTVIANFIFKEPLDTQGLYYFYCYDEGFRTFRVTDYHNYCPAAKGVEGYPITVEMIFKESCPEKDKLAELALHELRKMNLIRASDLPVFKAIEVLNYGFPLLTNHNVAILTKMRKSLADMNLQNYIQCGALSEPDVYFQREVLFDTHKKISGAFYGVGGIQ